MGERCRGSRLGTLPPLPPTVAHGLRLVLQGLPVLYQPVKRVLIPKVGLKTAQGSSGGWPVQLDRETNAAQLVTPCRSLLSPNCLQLHEGFR